MIGGLNDPVPKPMTPTTSYELYRKRGSDWMIVSAFDERDAAVSAAENLLETYPRAVVKVIAERFDAFSGETVGAVVYRNDLRDLPPPRSTPSQAARPRRVYQPAPAKPEKKRVLRVSIVVTLISGTTFAALLGSIRYLSRFLG
jgi:hypothetical protein